MPAPLPDLGIPAFFIVFAMSMLAMREHKAQRSVAGRWGILTGCALLLFGSALSVLAHNPTFKPVADLFGENSLGMTAEIVGYCGGFLALAIGMLQLALTESRRNEAAFRNVQEDTGARATLRSILDTSLSAVFVIDAVRDQTRQIVDFEFRLVNRASQEILGRDAQNLVGRRVLETFPCLRNDPLFSEVCSVIETGLPLEDQKYRRFRGSVEDFFVAASRLGDGVTITVADVSKRRQAEQQLRHAALHDSLTGLPNRALFAEKLESAILRARRQNAAFAVLFLDFDRFKIINDSLGHDVGDGLLKSIAGRLQSVLGAEFADLTGVREPLSARIGGDEFLVLLEGDRGSFETMDVSDRLQVALSEPHLIQGHEVVSTASIGIVTSDGDLESSETIIRLADAAMYQAKQSGKARSVLFDSRMAADVKAKKQLERDVRGAIERKEFVLAYEPVLNTRENTVHGCEALIRWQHPTRGLLFPGDFLDVLDEAGEALNVGRWVIAEACDELVRLQAKYRDQPILMHVNLSRAQLGDSELVPTVRDILRSRKLDPSQLVLEVTEDMMERSADHLEAQLRQLVELGVGIAMDDFGAGISSLDGLRRLPLRSIKIDRSFVTAARRHRDVASVFAAVISLAGDLGIEVVAEGVESREQLAMVQALGCNLVQGHLFGQPKGTETIEAMLEGGLSFGQQAA